MIGHVLGNYRIVGTLGRGGMGEVYVGQHILIDRRAAVKVLRSELSHKADMVRRFFNEARAASAIHHAGIVEIYDVGHTPEGRAFIVMELLTGESLGQRLEHLGTLSEQAAVAVLRHVADALTAAHEAGIVHRDLKPDNVFLVADPENPGSERIKLLDFGIAKLSATGGFLAPDQHTLTGTVMGTPAYMAPEQCRGDRNVDRRADLYALGCILYRMLCGRPPFAGTGTGAVLAAHIHLPVEPPRALNPTLGTDIEAVLLRLLQKDPAQRYQDTRELIAELDRLHHLAGAAAPGAGHPGGSYEGTTQTGYPAPGTGTGTGTGAGAARTPMTPYDALGAGVPTAADPGRGRADAGTDASGPGRLWLVVALLGLMAAGGGTAAWWLHGRDPGSAVDAGVADAGRREQVDAALPDAGPHAPLTDEACDQALRHAGTIMSAGASPLSASYLGYARYLDTPSETERLRRDCVHSYDPQALSCLLAAHTDVDVAACGDQLVARQCQRGDDVGCVSMGLRAYVSGDYDQAAARALAACDNAVSSGCALLATLHAYGRGRERDLDAAFSLYERAYALGDPGAGAALADMHLYGLGRPADPDAARALLEAICERAPDADACAQLAELELVGMGGRRARTRARERLERACEIDVPRACVVLGDDRGGAEAQTLYEKAHRLYQLSSAHSPRSAFRLAELVRDGKGTAASPRRARAALDQACTDGEALACIPAGDLFVDPGLPLRLDRARRAYRRACEAGFERGCQGVACQRLLTSDDHPDDWTERIQRCREQALLPPETRKPARRATQARDEAADDVSPDVLEPPK
ncbi:serine/threonine-protein kinase [Haliangium sp.]|uniref:serine/threonine-protein kinase n=1 Tax=Haliangium sp. TaxID=2663208 RepID=UPI003D0A49E9